MKKDAFTNQYIFTEQQLTMGKDKKLHLLFAAYMAGGNGTILENLENEIKIRNDVDSSWLRIELDPKKLIQYGTKQVSLIPGTIRNSMLTHERIRIIEKDGINFGAAFFFQHTICMGLIKFRSRVPYVIGMDGTPLFFAQNELWYAHPYFKPNSLNSKFKHMITKSVYKNASHLLPLSTKVRDSLINDYNISPNKITVVPPGIDLEKYCLPNRDTEERRKKPFNVLFVGADFIRKGGDLLVKLAGMEDFQDVQFNFVTKSYEGPRLKNIKVYDDITTNTEPMLNLLHDADIFVLPTRADSFSIASLEAMATGLPVIIVPVGGISDIVIDGETGYLIKKDDIEELSNRILKLRDDCELRYRMGANSRKRIETHFNIKTISNKVVELLKNAAAGKSSNGKN